MSAALTALIVDDEPPARRRLRALLGQLGVAVVGEAGSARAAEALLARHRPDVVLLDIEMRGEHGIDIARSWAGRVGVVFVTAHAQHAVAAFGVDAIDYVLKPVSAPRLLEALERAAARLPRRGQAPPRLVVRSTEGIAWLDTDSVLRIESAGDYVEFHLAGPQPSLLSPTTLGHWEATLPEPFVRVHRRHIVRWTAIQALVTGREGRRLELAGGGSIPVGRRYFEAVKARASRLPRGL
ncbi:LytTr DNA-binding domain family protein [Plesiocystis pacifica SIR-1]|uniref:LytTr DNA-binding domain family protein n=1 Tax=Plesiocystis pacifica SIR-1 TaxID=391625 RepID=A6FYA0_9BACT|nr:LytTR family DNA-binding domain-containing protein [Plesiocystis pacifica]EDM81479.1 LytTr DNA-binding domain family protein [Plesiocystis pacifica SIR-1]